MPPDGNTEREPKAASTRSTLGILATRFAILPISFVVSILVAVDLQASGYGMFHFLNLFVGPVLYVLSFGFWGGVTYVVGSGRYRPEQVLATCLVVAVGVGGSAAAVVGMLWKWGWLGIIGRAAPFSVILPVLAAMVLQAEQQMLYRLSMGASWFSVLNVVDLAKAVIMPVLLFLFVVIAGLGVQGAVYAILVHAFLLTVLQLYLVLRRCRPERRLSGDFVRASAAYGIRAWVGDLAAQASNRLDHMLFGFLASESLYGIYSIAVRVTELLWAPAQALSPVLFNRIASTSDEHERRFLIEQSHRVILVVVLLGGVVLASTVWWFIPLVYRGIFDASVRPAMILIPGTIAVVSYRVSTKYFSGSGHPEITSLVMACGAVTLGVLAFFFIPSWGPSGAALASSISYLLMALLAILFYRRMVEPSRPRLFSVRADDLRWATTRIRDALGVWRSRGRRGSG